MVIFSFNRTFAAVLRFAVVMVNGIYTIVLLILSNVFMTFAWYGHLRLQQSVDDRFLRVLLSGASQPSGLCGQRWPVLVGAVEGHPGVYLAGGVRPDCQLRLPA